MYKKIAKVINKEYVEVIEDCGNTHVITKDDRKLENESLVGCKRRKNSNSRLPIIDNEMFGVGFRGMKIA